jgi:hypothetical protein
MEEGSLKRKKEQNLGVLRTIMKFNAAQCSREGPRLDISSQQEVSIKDQDLHLKKLFLKYSCSEVDDHEEIYKYILHQDLIRFFSDFGFQEQLSLNPALKDFMDRKRQANGGHTHTLPYFLFDFMEILYILAERDAEDSCDSLALFLQSHIWPLYHKVTPDLWLTLARLKRNSHLVKFLKAVKFEKKVQGLFEGLVAKKKAEREQLSSLLMTFDDVLEITWQVKLFPLKISKKELRFNYLYCRSNENGLNAADLSDLLLVTGLKFGPHPTPELNLKWLAHYVTKSLK